MVHINRYIANITLLCYNMNEVIKVHGIDLNSPITYETASLREFVPNEHHVSLVCESDVLLLVLSGVLRFSEDGTAYEVTPGEYFIQRYNGIQRGDVASDCPKYLYIHFRGTWDDNRECLPKRGTFVVDEMTDIINRLNTLSYGGGTKTEILSVFYGILTILMNGSNHTETTAEKILRILTVDLNNPPTLSELAEICHFSKNHIIGIVKKEFGITPYEYLKHERLRHAARLIGSTSMSIELAAEQSGFNDYTVFFRAFKSIYGMSPSEWRDKIQS